MVIEILSAMDKWDKGHEKGLTAGDITEARGPHTAEVEQKIPPEFTICGIQDSRQRVLKTKTKQMTTFNVTEWICFDFFFRPAVVREVDRHWFSSFFVGDCVHYHKNVSLLNWPVALKEAGTTFDCRPPNKNSFPLPCRLYSPVSVSLSVPGRLNGPAKTAVTVSPESSPCLGC